jgi:hypothetical protein
MSEMFFIHTETYCHQKHSSGWSSRAGVNRLFQMIVSYPSQNRSGHHYLPLLPSRIPLASRCDRRERGSL